MATATATTTELTPSQATEARGVLSLSCRQQNNTNCAISDARIDQAPIQTTDPSSVEVRTKPLMHTFGRTLDLCPGLIMRTMLKTVELDELARRSASRSPHLERLIDQLLEDHYWSTICAAHDLGQSYRTKSTNLHKLSAQYDETLAQIQGLTKGNREEEILTLQFLGEEILGELRVLSLGREEHESLVARFHQLIKEGCALWQRPGIPTRLRIKAHRLQRDFKLKLRQLAWSYHVLILECHELMGRLVLDFMEYEMETSGQV